MKEYLIYRAPTQVDRDLGKHELVGVERGEDIFAATDAIIQAVCTDLSENPKYSGCKVWANAPEKMEEYHKTRRYQYSVLGVVSPIRAEENILVDYGVMEREEA